jgi:hypothetical protein
MFDGKKDINEKGSRKESVFADDFFEVNQLIVPKAIKEEIESQGMDIRWINSRRSHYSWRSCFSSSPERGH